MTPVLRALADLPEETWDLPGRGRLAWKTLFAGEVTPTGALTCGVALIPAGGGLAPHRHAQPEVYFGLEGRVRVTIEGDLHDLGPGDALFIPGAALHAIEGGPEPARFFYVFAADRFGDIVYDFPAETRDAP
jgi:quercetin dioxygenase-like cupin family protein